MSSDYGVIIARNNRTGAIELPLGDVTIYDTSGFGLDDELGGVGSPESIIKNVCRDYGPDWTITLYVPKGASYGGVRT